MKQNEIRAVMTKVLEYVNGEIFKKKLFEDWRYNKKYNHISLITPLLDQDVSDIWVLTKLRSTIGILHRNLNKKIRYEESEVEMYKHYMAQCMSYHSNKSFVFKILNKTFNILLKDYLVRIEEKVKIENVTSDLMDVLFLWGDIEKDGKRFTWSITGVSVDTSEEDEWTIGNLWDKDSDWVQLSKTKFKDTCGTILTRKDFLNLTNVEIKSMYDDLIDWSWERYSVQKKLIINAVKFKDEDNKLVTSMFVRHLYLMSIKSIMFYNKEHTHFEYNGIVNYDFYWKHKEKIDMILCKNFNDTIEKDVVESDNLKNIQDVMIWESWNKNVDKNIVNVKAANKDKCPF